MSDHQDQPAALRERILSGADARPWSLPSVGAPTLGPMTAAQLGAIEEDARKSGWEAGHAEGFAAGEQELARRCARLDQVFAGLAAPVAHLDTQIEGELLELVMAIARRLVRREIKTDPGEIIGVVREGIAALPVGERQVSLHLHPDDARLVAEVFSGRDGGPACRIIEDPALTRGGTRITTDISVIDATLETRINRVFDRMMGGERKVDEGKAAGDQDE